MNFEEIIDWLGSRNFHLYLNDNLEYQIDWYTPKGNELHSIHEILQALLIQAYEYEKVWIEINE